MRKFDKDNIRDILALTPMQEGLLFHYLKEPGSQHYFEQLSLTISGKIQPKHFENAWNTVIHSNEMLRAAFRWEKMDKPVQIILKEFHLKPVYHDLTSSPPGQTAKMSDEIKANDRENTFDLRNVPFRVTLCKLEDAKYEIIISNHHILYDGWSNGIILKEFFSTYHALTRHQSPSPVLKPNYKTFINHLLGRDAVAQEKFWHDYLKGFDETSELSVKQTKGQTATNTEPGNAHYPVNVSKAFKDQLENFTRSHKITLAGLFYGAWGLLLQRYNNREDILFGTTVSGRSVNIEGIEDIVGLFINTVPLRIRTNGGNETTGDFLSRLNRQLREREDYENTSPAAIKEYSRTKVQGELFDTIVVIENYPLQGVLPKEGEKENAGLSVDSFSMVEKTHYDLTLGITAWDEIEMDFGFNPGCFDPATIRNVARHFINLLEDIVDNPGKLPNTLDLLSEEEKNKILYDFNQTAVEYPKGKTIHGLFEAQVERTPFHTAIIFEDHRLTYSELNERANKVAGWLVSKGVSSGHIVGVMVDRSPRMVIGIMGILKTGGAYLPIAPDVPGERVRFMMKDSGAGILLNSETMKHENVSWSLGDFGIRISNLSPSGLAYIIYTSGTTGQPKAVAVEHSPAVNTLLCRKEVYGLGVKHVSLQLFPGAFDGFVTSFFTPLVSGTPVVLTGETDVRDPHRLKELIVKNRVTHFICLPALYRLILEALTPKEATSLEVVTIAGDRMFPELPEMSRRLNPSLEIAVEYGVTEAAVMSTIGRHREQAPQSGSIVGKPVWNTRLLILDMHLNLQPIGVPGELCISGAGLARGYLNRPALTQEKFELNSIRYHTGDLARWLEDGNIEFLGRIDHQVKIRGFRVELGEVQHRLSSHENIKEAVVVVQRDAEEDTFLCAYYIPVEGDYVPVQGDSIPPSDLLIPELRNHLSEVLPDYMVPSYFVPMENLPLTASGKVDRNALPAPGIAAPGDYTAPRGALEKTLVEIWAEILGMEPCTVGIDANFFHLGGHSLKAVTLISKTHKHLDVKVPLDSLFTNPTPRKMARYIRQAGIQRHADIEAVEKQDYYPLSSAQKRLYILRQVDLESCVYNMPAMMKLEKTIDEKKLTRVLKQLIKRHESLRTSFFTIDDQPVQRVHDHVGFRVCKGVPPWSPLHADHCGINNSNPGSHRGLPLQPLRDFIRPFDLSRAPLFRAGIIRTGEGHDIFMVDMHHIISDGVSLNILTADFVSLYTGGTLEPLKLQYRDFSEWNNGSFREKQVEVQRQWWLEQFEDEVPILNLPIDYPRPRVRSFEGAAYDSRLSLGETRDLKALALENN
ncbi:MAG: amino acid adenylation domain-containing protein, partial [bacterium]|nr:amino acid adenylation domain-containing protein [bacterium]